MTRLAILAPALVLAACAQEPDFGQQLRQEGGRVAALGQDWSEGDEMAGRGRALLEEGRDEVAEGDELAAEGRRKISRGEELLRRGETLRREAREAYQRQVRASDEG